MSLIILRFLHGLTWGVTTIAGATIAVDIIPANKRGEGIGYFGLSTTLGMSVGPVIGLFICHHYGYTAMFMAGIITSLVSLICACFIKLPLLQRAEVHFSWQNLFDRKSVIPSLNLLIIMSTYGGLLSFIALFGREIGIQNTSLFFLVFSIGIASSRLIAGKSFRQGGSGQDNYHLSESSYYRVAPWLSSKCYWLLHFSNSYGLWYRVVFLFFRPW
jgi:MFS family permease